MQVARHLIWDMIIAKAVKLRPYLNYILDKEMAIHAARQSCTTVKEALNKKPIDTFNNTINFLNSCVEAWKIAGNNSKGFSPVNVPN